MFRFLMITACLAVPVFSNSAGAPLDICKNNLVPEHLVAAQNTPVPFSFSGEKAVRSGGKLSLTLGGDHFLGYAVQVRDAKTQKPVGQFKVVESNKSQTLSCDGSADTLTHKKIPRDNPLTRVEFEWVAPQDFKGKVQVVGTVAKDGGTYWVRKVLKEVDVQ